MRTDSNLIAFFLPSLIGGGAERVMLNLANEMSRQGVNVEFVFAKAYGPYLSQLSKEIRCVDLKSDRMVFSLLPLARYLKSKKPHALISALDHVNIASILAKKIANVTTKNIITLHSSPSFKINKKNVFSRRAILHFLLKYAYPFADELVAVSKGVADSYTHIAKLNFDRFQIIYNPVINTELIEKSKQPVDHPWFNTKECPIVISAGRLSPEKNFSGLINAISLVRKKTPVRLVILGEGEQRGSLENLAENLDIGDSILLPGFVDNPYKFMAKADLFVLSSIREGLPTVLIEALATGTQVVSTNCKSGPEEILRGGELGRLVPTDDTDEMAKAIYESLTQDRMPVAPDALKSYSFEFAARQYIELIYNETC
jgi:glycosyltransferase involved in cell wall biosynthesis